MLGFSPKAVIHGVIDHALEQKIGTEAAIAVHREVNRIEGQLSLMMTHLDGEYESQLARLNLRKIVLPSVLGFIGGALVMLLVLKLV